MKKEPLNGSGKGGRLPWLSRETDPCHLEKLQTTRRGNYSITASAGRDRDVVRLLQVFGPKTGIYNKEKRDLLPRLLRKDSRRRRSGEGRELSACPLREPWGIMN